VPVTRTRRLTGEQRREVILLTAAEVFAEYGYQRGKVADIAARMEVTQPVIFQNFGTKAALYRAVLDQATTAACDILASVEQHNGSVSELLAMALSPSHVAAFHASGSVGALFADASGLLAEPEVGEAARDTISRVATALTGVLAYGQQAGDVRADLDPDAAAWWVMSLLSARTFRLEVASDQVEQRLVEMTMRMISSAGAAGERPVR
jgi:AcrR family transcriptional regulator